VVVLTDSSGDIDDDDDQRRCKLGREALSRAVALAAEAFVRPKPIHGVESRLSKFWATNDTDSEASVEEEIVLEEDNMSTPEFIAEAAAAGFSMKELKQAEQELSSSQVCSEPKNSRSLADKIVSVLVQRKLESRPWKGPLPPPRVSPPRTLEDQWDQFKATERGTRAVSEVWRYCSAPNFGVSMNRGQWHTDSVLPLAGEFRRR